VPRSQPEKHLINMLTSLIKSTLEMYMSVDDFLDDVLGSDEAVYICEELGIAEDYCSDFWTELINETDVIRVNVAVDEEKVRKIADKYRSLSAHEAE